jgi:hypothetical protein
LTTVATALVAGSMRATDRGSTSRPKQLVHALSGNAPPIPQLLSPAASIVATVAPVDGSTRRIFVDPPEANHRSPTPAVP